MVTKLLNKIWDYIDNLSTQTKTILIVLILGWSLGNYIVSENKNTIKNLFQSIELEKYESEQYTIKMAPEIDRAVQGILDKDPDASNVILLSYHNSTRSLQGFSYQYLNCLTEKTRGINAVPTKRDWHELEYIYYIDELQKINDLSLLRINNIDSIQISMPKFYNKLKACDAKSAAFYPITGSTSPIGLIIVLYKKTKIYPHNYYPMVVGPEVSKLAAILDYDNIKNLVKD